MVTRLLGKQRPLKGDGGSSPSPTARNRHDNARSRAMPGIIEPIVIGLVVKVVRKRTPNWRGWQRMDDTLAAVKAHVMLTRREEISAPCCIRYRTARCRCD